jgi:hypothetical protein
VRWLLDALHGLWFREVLGHAIWRWLIVTGLVALVVWAIASGGLAGYSPMPNR